MAVKFAWRSDTSTGFARYGYNTEPFKGGLITSTAHAGAIGGNVWTSSDTHGGLYFGGENNFGAASGGAFSLLCRVAPNFASLPSAEVGIMNFGAAGSDLIAGGYFSYRTNGFILGRIYNDKAALTTNIGFVWTITAADTYHDLLFTGYLNDPAGTFKFYINGTQKASGNMFDLLPNFTSTTMQTVGIGSNDSRRNDWKFNELVIWDEIVDPTNVTLVSTGGTTSTGQSLNGNSRTGWVDVEARDLNTWTSITAAQIADGVEQIQGGFTQTGSLAIETWSTISAAEIKSGVDQIQNGVTVTGTYLWDTITADKILNGTTHIQDGVTFTGSLVAPAAASGTSTAIDIPNIKEQVRWVLDQNNTTTSSVLDLSASMTKRVQQVAKVNPEKIAIQSTKIPAVTVYTSKKSIEPQTIARNQLNGKRKATITLTVVGMVWNDNFSADIYNDQADQDLEYLMENTERILRSYHDLGNNVTWQIPTSVEYHGVSFDEQTHFRVGLLDIDVTVYY